MSSQGYAAFLPIVIRGNLKVPSLFGEAIASVDFRVFDANTCSDCQRASEAKANLTMDFVANNTFFGEDAARILLERQDPESLKFSCINNVTCAWGLGWCSTCFQTRIEERAGVETYRDDLPGFLKEGQRGTQNIAEDDIRGVVQEMNVECQTVCTTTIQISFNGNDSWGQLLNSALMMVYTNGFDWIAKFQRYYGLPNTVIEDLTQIEAKNEENIVGSNQELEEEVS